MEIFELRGFELERESQLYIISDLNGEKIVGSFYEKELQKTNQKKVIIEK